MNGHAASRTPPSVPFATAASRVAVAQICLSIGYAGAEAPALRVFADVAGRYLHALGRSAAAAAGVRGRTDANLLDLVRAMEDLGSGWGLAGAASDPARPLLRSPVLRELMAFVGFVDEIPFPKPIRREREGRRVSSSPSFAEMAREPPFRHVPRWLPCFPAERGGKSSEEEMTASNGDGEEGKEERIATPLGLGEGKKGILPAKRRAVSFPLRKKTMTNEEGRSGGKTRRRR